MSEIKRVLFVCSGNFYRSRLAEILFNEAAEKLGMDWEAESRGLLKTGELKGMSDHVVTYLRDHELSHLAVEPRDPLLLDVEDITAFDLIVGLCREEHEPIINKKYLSLARAMVKAGRLRYWRIYDIPAPPPVLVRLLGGGHGGPSQPPASGTEHIAFAVRDLLKELSGGFTPGNLRPHNH
ncbi:MAG: low molecular weight phosphatase family protein [Chthoniobacterales bacterium]